MSHRNILVRQATRADAAALLDCLAAAFEPYRTRYTHNAYLDTVLTRETLTARLNSMRVLVAVTGDGHVIGTIACALASPDVGHLRGMAVLPDWLGRGIAERLLSTQRRISPNRAALESRSIRPSLYFVPCASTRSMGITAPAG